MTSQVGGRSPDPVRFAAADLPECLRDLSHPPAALWCLGDAASLSNAPEGLVAIVGTREASEYGVRTARRLAAACTRAGLVVVSGLARGIDAAAHRAALDVGGRTVAVQGTGVDVPYPVAHRALHREIQRQGAVLSEMEPGTGAKPGCFPRRNRLIAALARVTVVVEAPFKSGAINTATQALELGRTVAAVPGPIDDPRAAGANALIRDGAQVVTSVDDLLGLYGLSTPKRGAGEDAGLDPADRNLLALVGEDGSDAERIAQIARTPLRHVLSRLSDLELQGRLVRDGDRYVVARRS